MVERSPIKVPNSHQSYFRLKYYSALKTGLGHLGEGQTYLNIPMSVIDSSWFLIPHIRQSSAITIFSICNWMMGSSLISLPWAYSQSGIVLGIIISFLLFLVWFYTWYLVVLVANNDEDYSDTVYKYFGK